MSDKILANETYVREGGAVIRTRCDQRHVSDSMIGLEAQRHKLDVGDVITVQCMTHERDTVLWQRRYLIACRRDFLRRTETLMGDIKHEDAFEIRVVPMDEWWEITPKRKKAEAA